MVCRVPGNLIPHVRSRDHPLVFAVADVVPAERQSERIRLRRIRHLREDKPVIMPAGSMLHHRLGFRIDARLFSSLPPSPPIPPSSRPQPPRIAAFCQGASAAVALTPNAILRIEVQLLPVVHEMALKAAERWANGPSVSPRGQAIKRTASIAWGAVE
jgi:hypothetical protein